MRFLWLFIFIPSLLTALDIHSEDVMAGGKLPLAAYHLDAGGQNLSPELEIKGIPPMAQSLAFIVVDEHPAAGKWVVCCLINLPPQNWSVKSGSLSADAPAPEGILLPGSSGFVGWQGPLPTPGSGKHPISFWVVALKTPALEWSGEISWNDFQNLVKGKVVGQSKLTVYASAVR